MATIGENFAHGSYGDYWGVVFYGPLNRGFWDDQLAVSDRFINPLFKAVIDRAYEGETPTPRLARDWIEIVGWKEAGGKVEISVEDARELIAAFEALSMSDILPHVAGATVEECLQCASVIGEFLTSRLAKGFSVYIEND